jgi:hypothetical protein
MRNIRLVEDRRCPKAAGRDWKYIVLGCVVWFGLVLATPLVRALASWGW